MKGKRKQKTIQILLVLFGITALVVIGSCASSQSVKDDAQGDGGPVLPEDQEKGFAQRHPHRRGQRHGGQAPGRPGAERDLREACRQGRVPEDDQVASRVDENSPASLAVFDLAALAISAIGGHCEGPQPTRNRHLTRELTQSAGKDP